MNQIYRKLKDYMSKEGITTTVIFGDLCSSDCVFHYEKNGKWIEHKGGSYDSSLEFLYDYYVKGISADYKIVNDQIIPYLSITLSETAN